MKKRIFGLLCLLLALPLIVSPAACAEVGDYAAFCEGRLFADGLPEEALPRPERCIDGLEDFVYALDYLAFYRIGEAVYFDIDPVYAESFFNPYTVFQRAYLQSDLADVYACQLIDTYYSQYRVVALKYSMSREIATKPPERVPDSPVVPSFDFAPKGDSELPIPIERSGREEIPCENGEQLYYLAMNGYRPMPVAGSVAEQLYEAACAVIRERIRPDQSDFEKIKAIYDYLTTEVVYDRETAYSAETYLVREQAYYLEGVFFNHYAVCDGKAKAYALLLNLLDIPCYRQTGVSGFADHAWNMVRLGGKWYVSCSTYGQSNAAASLGRILPNYSMLLASRETPYGDEDWGYLPQKHPDIYDMLEEAPFDVYGAMGELDGVNLEVESLGELQALLERISREGEYKVEFVYAGTEDETFREQMIDYLYGIPGVNAVEVKSEGGRVYQVIYLQEQ